MLHCDRVKIFVDGVLETYTALMLEGYPGPAGEHGRPPFTAEEFNEIVTRADRHGLQVVDPCHRRRRRPPHARCL